MTLVARAGQELEDMLYSAPTINQTYDTQRSEND
jgi:hypothetical protein